MADSFAGADPVQRRLRRLPPGERREEALDFLRHFARETGIDEAARARREREIRAELRATGTYRHTSEELAFGARLAWRNHARCIGRLWWKSLDVIDCRDVTAPAEVAGQIFEHVRQAYSNGRLRSRITIFAPVTPGGTPTTVESPQVMQYAGWLRDDGGTIGDRQNIELTRTVARLGWTPPAEPGPFDLLPLLVRGADGRRYVFEIPDDLRQEVEIRHPDRPGLNELGLRWYAVPCVTNMIMTIGGVEYPCAPFSGHYMATEIASRDFADQKRYDMLPEIGRALGLDVSANADPLWRDEALTELNRAVLHSFRAAGVEIIDHHSASAQFMEFVKLEQREGRAVSADWSWIVPPQAAAGCPVFHLPMEDRRSVPNFFLSRSLDGGTLKVDLDRQRLNRWQRRMKRIQRRWWDWQRRRDGLFRRE